MQKRRKKLADYVSAYLGGENIIKRHFIVRLYCITRWVNTGRVGPGTFVNLGSKSRTTVVSQSFPFNRLSNDRKVLCCFSRQITEQYRGAMWKVFLHVFHAFLSQLRERGLVPIIYSHTEWK